MDREDFVRAREIAEEVLRLTRNELMVSLRFMDLALSRLPYEPMEKHAMATDGKELRYHPLFVFQAYGENSRELSHCYLHLVFHCIFYHPFGVQELDRRYWDLACDIAVEDVLSELGIKQIEIEKSSEIKREIGVLKLRYGKLTAERIYKHLTEDEISEAEYLKLSSLFTFDDHFMWHEAEEEGEKEEITEERLEWQKISERAKVDLETSSRDFGDRSLDLMMNIREVNRVKYDYSGFLRKFSVQGEEVRIDDDSFDYIFYTYGLGMYGNMPLVEPLEYKDVKKIKDFVIAIDTSHSVKGELVNAFLEKTFSILTERENFFTKVNIHIVQCDADIQRVDRVSSMEEFENLLTSYNLIGGGGTDFRPVFQYIDEIKEKEFFDLKGIIYFTDGYGRFPEEKPDYEAAFVFLRDEDDMPEVPPWAIRLVLNENDI